MIRRLPVRIVFLIPPDVPCRRGDRELGLLTHGTDSQLHALNADQSVDDLVELKSYMDSGAARSVCPKRFAEQFGLTPSAASLKGKASGQQRTNVFRIRAVGS